MLTELAKWTLQDWIAVACGIATGSTLILAIKAECHEAYKRGVCDGARQMFSVYMGKKRADESEEHF